jgi:IS4 transposase
VAKLFCFCKIVGADHPTKVVHVWYLDGTERGRVTLAVNGSPWRTYSSKRLRPQDTGTWHVDILDADGNLLDHLPFIIEP